MISHHEPPIESWRTQIIDGLYRAFGGEGNALYGPHHAILVEEALQALLARLGYSDNQTNITLRAAALLHDIGFAQRIATWQPDAFEHLAIGRQLAANILGQIHLFEEHPTQLNYVLELIEHHDDTTYAYPGPGRQGTIINYPLILGNHSDLHLLREADATVHNSRVCIDLSINEWVGQGVPLVPESGAPLSTWRWMESVTGNIRLLAKRWIVDAFTPEGQASSWSNHDQLEQWIADQCQRVGRIYEADPLGPDWRVLTQEFIGEKPFTLQLLAYDTFSELTQALRQITLQHDRNVFPYSTASIESSLVSIGDLTPMALYVMQHRLDETLELESAMVLGLHQTLFDLPGLLCFRFNNADIQHITAPLVERYRENPGDEPILGLVDGLHRCFTARQLGALHMRTTIISNVPFPLVPQPTIWESVRIYSAPPLPDQKRIFRFERLEDFPTDRFQLATTVTRENFRYFFYRDLALLGSKGARFQ